PRKSDDRGSLSPSHSLHTARAARSLPRERSRLTETRQASERWRGEAGPASAARSDGRGLELQRVAVRIVAQHLDAPARLRVLDVLDPLALERGLHRLVVGHLEAGVATERADGRAGTGRLHLRLDDVDLGKDARRTEPVATRRERRSEEHLESQHPAIEVLRPLRVGGRDALVLDA